MTANPQLLRRAGAEIILRPTHAGDLAAIHHLAQQMSWPHRLEDCVQLFELGAGTTATARGRTVGVGMRWSFGYHAGTIGMVIVAPDWQGRGIGRALMTTLIAESATRALMLNATAEGLGLYEKLGFVQAGLVHQHQGHLTEGAALPPAPAIALRRALQADHSALCTLDAGAFGADRSALIRRFLATGEAWLIERSDRPVGFAVLRAFGRGSMIGPILAPSEDEAIALVAAAAGAAPPGLLRVDVPACAARLSSWLVAAGLAVVDPVTAMVLGTWPVRRAKAQRFGLAHQSVG